MGQQFLPLASVIAIIGLLLSSCITQSWDVPIPVVTQHAAIEEIPESSQISLYIPEYLSQGPSFSNHPFLPPPHIVLGSLKREIDMQSELSLFKVTREFPEVGVFCSLRLEETEMPPMAKAWSLFTHLTLWLVPFYDSSLSYHVTYELFVDAKLRKRYQYRVHGKAFEWAAAVLAIPFMSGNWHVQLQSPQNVSHDLRESLWLTTRLFWNDAQRDGFLP
ncbi:MAG: hypothetical protein ABL970_13625 [Nitrospira sp.]